jgi:hypothetical protein
MDKIEFFLSRIGESLELSTKSDWGRSFYKLILIML